MDRDVLTISGARELIASGTLSSTELTSICLDRITNLDPHLNSFVFVNADQALARARNADEELRQGLYRGPLHGIPYALKDVFDVAGVTTTGGSRAFCRNIATGNAAVVDRLDEAGAIFLGKLATHELTHGGVSADLPWPPAHNPWNIEHDTGGSSTGAGAAVATGLCLFALGTDTGGSVRSPAALCGVTGLKPTYGRISREGVMLNSYTLDHCGILTWTVEDCVPVLDAVSDRDPHDTSSSNSILQCNGMAPNLAVSGARVGVVSNKWLEGAIVHPDVEARMAQAVTELQSLGANVSTIDLPSLQTYNACKLTIQRPEFFSLYGSLIQQRPDEFSVKLRNRVSGYDAITAVEYLEARRVRRLLRQEMVELMANVDVIVTPGSLAPAPRLRDSIARTDLNGPDITIPFNVTGFPAASICIGFASNGLPVAMQVIAKPFEELVLLQICGAYERATPWRNQRPVLMSH
jgi:aspartyl-tRNA(Asn)/glutamyl-tRNA(Gln) amidotransferase subunit A